MEAAEIIEYLRNRELTVCLTDDENLELSPVEKITNDLIERLRKHKPAIIAELKREQNQKIELILAWLFQIGEPVEDHYLVLDKCRSGSEVMQYFLKHTRGEFAEKRNNS